MTWQDEEIAMRKEGAHDHEIDLICKEIREAAHKIGKTYGNKEITAGLRANARRLEAIKFYHRDKQ